MSSVGDTLIGCRTLVDAARVWAHQQPESRAFTFLDDGAEAGFLSYAGLDQQAREIAALLLDRAKPGDRALLIYPQGLDFIAGFFGCLYAGVIAVPVYPPKPSGEDMPRLLAILDSSAPALTLSVSSMLSIAEQAGSLFPQLASLPWIATDSLSGEGRTAWREPDLVDDTLAFLQYTSGSTSHPKGVMVTHGNLMANMRMIEHNLGHTHETSYVNWLPLYHDMGLIGNVLHVVYLGTHCAFMSPLSFLKKPYHWLDAVSRYRANTSGGPNFGYDLCVRKITDEQKATLDLSSWTHAFNGAEPVRAAPLERFMEAFASCGFRPNAVYPCYGLAEGTLYITGALTDSPRPALKTVRESELGRNKVLPAQRGSADSVTLVGCGRASLDEQIIIVNPETRTACEEGEAGEIWLAGPMVAKGYWGLADETEDAFCAYLADTGAGPYLRTGDLGFLDEDGELFITGRIKDLIIVAGRNHYPQDIEQTVEHSSPAVRAGNCIAFSVDANGEEQLVVVFQIERQYRDGEVEALVKTVRRAITERHSIGPHDIVVVRQPMPKTTSGKLQRWACRADYLAGRLRRAGDSA